MKKILFLVSAAMFAFVSCNFNPPTKEGNHQALHAYLGTAVIDKGAYETDPIQVDFITSDSIKGAYMVYFHDAKFAEKMPQMDIVIEGVVNTDVNTYECDSIVPDMVMGIIRVPVERYLIRNLKAVFSEKNGDTYLSLEMMCGPYFLEFDGVYDAE